MFSKKYFSRLLPFFATFLVGIFVAGLFGSIWGGSFQNRRARHFSEDRQIRAENEQLREEVQRLRSERMNFKGHRHCDRSAFWSDRESTYSDSDVRDLLPPPPPIPAYPASPRAIR